jgi:hypothetical protein
MKLFIFLIAIIFGTGMAKAQVGWIDYKIDSKLSVKLPKQPIKLNEHSVYVKDQDSTIYVISSVDMLKTDGLDSLKVQSLAPTAEFANQIRNSLQKQMKASALSSVNINKWNGYTSYSIDGYNPTKETRLYSLTVIIGTNLYGLMIILHSNQNNINKENFFSSLKLN